MVGFGNESPCGFSEKPEREDGGKVGGSHYETCEDEMELMG